MSEEKQHICIINNDIHDVKFLYGTSDNIKKQLDELAANEISEYTERYGDRQIVEIGFSFRQYYDDAYINIQVYAEENDKEYQKRMNRKIAAKKAAATRKAKAKAKQEDKDKADRELYEMLKKRFG